MCAVVGLLGRALDLLGGILGSFGSLLSAIAGLPAKIMDLLGGILSDLFVPSSAGIQDNVQSLSDTAGNATNGWADAVSSPFGADSSASAPTGGRVAPEGRLATTGASAGCAGMGFTVPGQLGTALGGGGVLHPFSSCSAQVAPWAEKCRLICMALLALFALMKTFELVRAGLGVGVDIRIIDGMKRDGW
jgi:hypothetical protein